MNIAQCTERHLQAAAELFNDYRQFYEQESDFPGCYQFIKNNVTSGRSTLYLLFEDDGKAVGFAQLYPTYCSIAMKPYYYLSDLYIAASCRRKGYARHLMNHLTEASRAEGAHRLTLDTATSNKIAQGLYESLGYQRENVYITYHQTLGPVDQSNGAAD